MSREGEATDSSKPTRGTEERDLQAEQTLCWAIEQRRQVTFSYRKDGAVHTLRPTVLYWSANGKLNLGGTVVNGAPTAGMACERHVFEVGRISRLIVTSISFDPDPLFDRRDKRYDGGIICSV